MSLPSEAADAETWLILLRLRWRFEGRIRSHTLDFPSTEPCESAAVVEVAAGRGTRVGRRNTVRKWFTYISIYSCHSRVFTRKSEHNN